MEKQIFLMSIGVALISALLGWAVSDTMQRYNQAVKNIIIGSVTGFTSSILLLFIAREMYFQHVKSQITTVSDTVSYVTSGGDISKENFFLTIAVIALISWLLVGSVVYYMVNQKPKEALRPKKIIVAVTIYLLFALTSTLPLGMLYTSWKATIVNVLVLVIVLALLVKTQNPFFAIFLLVFPIIACIWIVKTIKKQNKALLDNMIET